MITKKHFNKISEIIRKELQPKAPAGWAFGFVQELADYFEKENPNFNRGKFIHACYHEKK